MIECMPQEIEVRYILPAIRREFARILIEEKNFSQKETAKFLDITEAAVSQYINAKRAKDIMFSGDIINEMRRSIDKLNVKHSKAALIGEVYRISNLTTTKRILCDIHKAHSKDLEDCNVCFEEGYRAKVQI